MLLFVSEGTDIIFGVRFACVMHSPYGCQCNTNLTQTSSCTTRGFSSPTHLVSAIVSALNGDKTYCYELNFS